MKFSVYSIILLFALGLLMSSCKCDGPSDIESVAMFKPQDQELPDGLILGERPGYKVLIKVEFKIDIDPSNLSAPGNFNISAKGTSGREDADIQGSVQYFSGDKTAYFISTNELGFSPNAGENITYTIQIVGVGQDCVKRLSGECIDGCDDDTDPGKNYVTKITVIG